MSEPEHCQRCLQPISGQQTVLLVDSGLPESKMQEMTICGRCLKSYQRWATHGSRHSEATPSASKSADPAHRKSGRQSKRHEPATETEARDRAAARMRVRLIGITASIALVAYLLLSLIAYVLFGEK
jgi:hypothetical protein